MFCEQEENDIGEIFMSLEKDPQQEDFLQGRMLGNPYSSNEPGLGPLMRDVKNKICQGTAKSFVMGKSLVEKIQTVLFFNIKQPK